MKRILIVGAFALLAGGQALAADLPPPVAPPPRAPAVYVPVAQVFSWTGIYLGINGGGAYGRSSWADPSPLFPPTGTFAFDGYLVGGTVGGNYQIGSFVIGLEGDGDWSHLSGTTFNTSCVVVGCQTKSDWLATVRGRAGWAWGRVMFYGTGGAAFANVQAAAGAFPFSSSTQAGWVAGVGIEYAFMPNWTAKVEYLFVDLGNQPCSPVNCSGTATSVSLNESIIRGGINYKFW
jgi:outer membrane immunogenic protein